MLRRCLPYVAIVAVFVCTAMPAAKIPSGVASRSLALELTVKPNRNVYRMSDPLQIETQLRNVGEGDVYIWEWDMCWNPARGLSMRIIGADGKDVQSPFLLDGVPPPPRQGNAHQFVKLPPERFYGLAEHFKLSELVNGPGEYDVDATFNSFLSSKWTAEFLG